MRIDLPALLDTRVLLSLFLDDAFSGRTESALAPLDMPVVSDFACARLASGVARTVRTGEVPRDVARDVPATLDAWRDAETTAAALTSGDISVATSWLRRLDLNLREADALHLATTSRLALPALTFDTGMATAARAVGPGVAEA